MSLKWDTSFSDLRFTLLLFYGLVESLLLPTGAGRRYILSDPVSQEVLLMGICLDTRELCLSEMHSHKSITNDSAFNNSLNRSCGVISSMELTSAKFTDVKTWHFKILNFFS